MKDLTVMLRSTWNWKLFGRTGAKCFGETRIEPTDIDMVIERNGYFLAVESKLPQKRDLDGGQLIFFRKLLWVAPFTLLLVFGEAETQKLQRLEAWRKGVSEESPARFALTPSMLSWFDVTKKWFEWADGMPTMSYKGPIWSFDRAIQCRRLDLENAIPIEQERYALQT